MGAATEMVVFSVIVFAKFFQPMQFLPRPHRVGQFSLYITTRELLSLSLVPFALALES